jgi:hypothetical protein
MGSKRYSNPGSDNGVSRDIIPRLATALSFRLSKVGSC